MINLLLFLAAGVAAYLLTCTLGYIDYLMFRNDLKKFFKSDLNKYKARKIYQVAKDVFIDNGYSEEDARKEAIIYIDAATKNGELDEKYKLLIGA